MKIIELKESITASNDEDARVLREELKQNHTLLINLMASPGAGKTTFLGKTIKDVGDKIKIGIIEADIDSDVDAKKLAELGVEAVQAHTDGMCHMDAGMTRKALEELNYQNNDLVFLENVGNLICPAEFDTGAGRNVMILSVPEGDDKPLKYPLMFTKSDVLIITKIDTISVFDFDFDKCEQRAKKLNPNIQIFKVSAKTGEGMEEWEKWLSAQVKQWV
ncbi:MAG: hydrogenase nickel incorporation protein HypB [Erysipelotrichaceae bacterium]|nr:hydrogenase nickel incorporation protein HypB [Erysipelotrichaceae bacterium]